MLALPTSHDFARVLKYLTIPVGEFMEIHLAPATKTVLRERWLKQDEDAKKKLK